jgi:hypothetical protein
MYDQSPPTPPPLGGASRPVRRYDPSAATPYDTLLGAIDGVIGEWRTLVQREPWAAMPPARLVDSLPEILPKMIRLARGGGAEVDAELRETIAAAHGFFRRQDNVPLVAVAEEWSHVRRACRTVLQREGVDDDEARGAMTRLDALIDDAIGFSLRGYYAPELDSLRGRGLERRNGLAERRGGTGSRRDAGAE